VRLQLRDLVPRLRKLALRGIALPLCVIPLALGFVSLLYDGVRWRSGRRLFVSYGRDAIRRNEVRNNHEGKHKRN
jgi:hypothetical protein